VRFDDSLKTVMAADTDTAFGAASAWRQIVDLLGRGRAVTTPDALDRLRVLRGKVPDSVRAASARALAFAAPGPELVSLFAEEELAIAAPVLRTAQLSAAAWETLLPRLTPAQRSVLRHRRDLPGAAVRGLAHYGPVDFVLPYDAPVEPGLAPASAPVAVPAGEGSLSQVGAVALPVIAEAIRRADVPDAIATSAEPPLAEPVGFRISDLVARIEAFNRDRETVPADPPPTSTEFRYHTDAAGVIRWVDGVARAAVVGTSLAHRDGAEPQVDGIATGAFRRRTAFRDARLSIGGASPAAGSWRISGTPLFDPASGRFTGYRGTARRPRSDETARPRSPAADSVRELVHELRTPVNAIAGFAELIESEMLGAVPAAYRGRAGEIRGAAADLIGAIDDLDTAARIEGQALELRPAPTPLAPLLDRVVHDLAPLARFRGAEVVLAPVPPLILDVDDRAADRLFGRLLSALVSSCARGERLHVFAMRETQAAVRVVFDRPVALAAVVGDGLLSIDAEQEAAAPGAPLLGTGFALRLAQNLAGELGGVLVIETERLTLRLPAAVPFGMGQASTR